MRNMKKICVVCHNKIIERKERWVRLTDFNIGEQTGEVFYHTQCWKDRYNIGNSLKKQKMYDQTKELLSKVFNAASRNSNKGEQVYEIGQVR